MENEKLDFDIVLGFREGFEKGKAHFDYVKDKFGLDKEDMTFVGDSLKDAEKAYNYASVLWDMRYFQKGGFPENPK